MKIETLLTHLSQQGEINDPHKGSFFPIYNTATFDVSKQGVYDYTRAGSPSLDSLNKVFAKAESGFGTLSINTGLGAIGIIFKTCLKANSKLIVEQDLYGGSQRLLQRYQEKYNIEPIYMDLTHLENLENRLKKGDIDLIHCESPTNPGLKILNLKEISKLAKQYGSKLSVDNSLATFASQKPLELGADFSVSSTTKYISGHGTVIAGIVTAKSQSDYEILKKEVITEGCAQNPMDAFIISLGLATLPIRLKQHEASALTLSKYLSQRKEIKKVVYPGLPSHPQHELAKSQMKYFNGVITAHFEDVTTAENFIKKTKLFGSKVSFGSGDSRVQIPSKGSHASCSEETLKRAGIYPSSVRISVGLEHVDDLLSDVEQALNN